MLLVLALAAVLWGWSAVSDLLLGTDGYVLRNLVATGALLGVARQVGMRARDLGLSRDRVVSGLRVGGVAVGVVLAALTLGVVAGDRLGPLGALLHDDRAALPTSALLYAVLVRIPVGTVVFEEVAFRGVLDAACERVWRPLPAAAVSAAVFGLYHVPPTMVALRENAIAPLSATGLGSLTGAVAATSVAGALFTWLRRRSGSLVAPMLAHIATNVGGLLAAAAVQRGLTPS